MNDTSSTDWLILVPTPFERSFIPNSDLSQFESSGIPVEVAGFGPVASAARTSQLLARYQPSRVMLIGIAGSYDSQLVPGSAAMFSNVALWGVGAGEGSEFQTAGEMGWMHFQNEQTQIEDVIELDESNGPMLLTVCSAASDLETVQARKAKYAQAVAEDMEGFGVAAACKLHQVPLQIIRGISNMAGDRDKANWQIEAAMHSAIEVAKQSLSDSD